MKIVVIGGSGLIGKAGSKLREHGHEAVAASLKFRRQHS